MSLNRVAHAAVQPPLRHIILMGHIGSSRLQRVNCDRNTGRQ